MAAMIDRCAQTALVEGIPGPKVILALLSRAAHRYKGVGNAGTGKRKL